VADSAELISTADAAAILGVSSERVRQMIRSGLLNQAGHVGPTIVLRRSDVERLSRDGWPGRRSRANT
jgi:hypothetical protein